MLDPKKYPKSGTSSSERYFFADLEVGNFLNWIAFMAGSIDRVRKVAKEALDEVNEDEREAEVDSEDGDEGIMIQELKKNRLIIIHMLHTRMVDNYLTYLSEILVECFTAKPEAMRSSEKVEISEILQYDNFQGIVEHVAEKKVHSLSYQSITDLDSYFVDKFNVHIVEEKDKEFLIKAIETRNLITHNRGIRNKIYIQKVGEDESEIGKIRDIGIDFSEKVNKLFYNSVKQLDSSLRKKLGVPGHRFDIYESFKERA